MGEPTISHRGASESFADQNIGAVGGTTQDMHVKEQKGDTVGTDVVTQTFAATKAATTTLSGKNANYEYNFVDRLAQLPPPPPPPANPATVGNPWFVPSLAGKMALIMSHVAQVSALTSYLSTQLEIKTLVNQFAMAKEQAMLAKESDMLQAYQDITQAASEGMSAATSLAEAVSRSDSPAQAKAQVKQEKKELTDKQAELTTQSENLDASIKKREADFNQSVKSPRKQLLLRLPKKGLSDQDKKDLDAKIETYDKQIREADPKSAAKIMMKLTSRYDPWKMIRAN